MFFMIVCLLNKAKKEQVIISINKLINMADVIN